MPDYEEIQVIKALEEVINKWVPKADRDAAFIDALSLDFVQKYQELKDINSQITAQRIRFCNKNDELLAEVNSLKIELEGLKKINKPSVGELEKIIYENKALEAAIIISKRF